MDTPKLETSTFDADKAAVVLTLGALAFLWMLRRGFRGVVVSVGS